MVKGGVRNIFCSLCFSELPYQKERAQKRDERVNASQNDNRSRVARLYGRRVRRELSGSQIVALTLLSARFAVSRCGMLTERSLAALGLSWCPSCSQTCCGRDKTKSLYASGVSRVAGSMAEGE